MKTEVILCDKCKKQVANSKCEFCNKDVCNNCSLSRKIDFLNREISVIILCENCSNNIYKFLQQTDDFDKQQNKLKKLVLDMLKQNFIVKELMKGGKK